MTYYSQAQKKASRKYNEAHYSRIGLYLPPEEKERWEEAAKQAGQNLSEFIKQCVNDHLREGG